MTTSRRPGGGASTKITAAALVGGLVVVLLLTWPMTIRKPGDHENGTCGIPVRMDLSAYIRPVDEVDAEYYNTMARQRCAKVRTQRFFFAGVVAAVTALIVVGVWRGDRAEQRRRAALEPPAAGPGR